MWGRQVNRCGGCCAHLITQHPPPLTTDLTYPPHLPLHVFRPRDAAQRRKHDSVLLPGLRGFLHDRQMKREREGCFLTEKIPYGHVCWLVSSSGPPGAFSRICKGLDPFKAQTTTVRRVLSLFFSGTSTCSSFELVRAFTNKQNKLRQRKRKNNTASLPPKHRCACAHQDFRSIRPSRHPTTSSAYTHTTYLPRYAHVGRHKRHSLRRLQVQLERVEVAVVDSDHAGAGVERDSHLFVGVDLFFFPTGGGVQSARRRSLAVVNRVAAVCAKIKACLRGQRSIASIVAVERTTLAPLSVRVSPNVFSYNNHALCKLGFFSCTLDLEAACAKGTALQGLREGLYSRWSIPPGLLSRQRRQQASVFSHSTISYYHLRERGTKKPAVPEGPRVSSNTKKTQTRP